MIWQSLVKFLVQLVLEILLVHDRELLRTWNDRPYTCFSVSKSHCAAIGLISFLVALSLFIAGTRVFSSQSVGGGLSF